MTAEHQDRPPAPEPYQVGFQDYLSPFTYRYGSSEMRTVWSQKTFWTNVRKIWIAVAEVQEEAGLTTSEQVNDLKAHLDQISVERIWQLERDPKSGTGHDVAAAIAEYGEVAKIGGEILHQGLTSEDTLSNAEVMQILESFQIIRSKLITTLDAFGQKIDQYKNLVCTGLICRQQSQQQWVIDLPAMPRIY
jgi:adenylosuccinate lyase